MIRHLAPLVLLLVVVGCVSGDNVDTDIGYLQFLGDTAGARFTLRAGGEAVPLTRVQTQQRYRLSPGRYTLSVVRRGRTVLDRRIDIVAGKTVDVPLP